MFQWFLSPPGRPLTGGIDPVLCFFFTAGAIPVPPAPPMQRDGTGGFRRARIFRRDNSDDMAAIAVALQVLGADMISEAEAEQLEIAGVVQVLDAVGWFG